MNTEEYLRRVFRWSFFPKQERNDRLAEIRAHLEDKMCELTRQGMAPDDAERIVVLECGSPAKLRAELTASAYGIPSVWIAGSTLLFLSLLVLFAALLSPFAAFSPSLMACLAGSAVWLLTTRKARDRWAIVITLSPFCLAYLQSHTFPSMQQVWGFAPPLAHPSMLAVLLLPSWPFYSAWSIAGFALLAGVGLALYAWTRNLWSAVIPFLFSISVSLWPVARDFVKYEQWRTTHSSIFWNPSPLMWPNSVILVSVLVRVSVLCLTLVAIRIIAARRVTKSDLITN